MSLDKKRINKPGTLAHGRKPEKFNGVEFVEFMRKFNLELDEVSVKKYMGLPSDVKPIDLRKKKYDERYYDYFIKRMLAEKLQPMKKSVKEKSTGRLLDFKWLSGDIKKNPQYWRDILTNHGYPFESVKIIKGIGYVNVGDSEGDIFSSENPKPPNLKKIIEKGYKEEQIVTKKVRGATPTSVYSAYDASNMRWYEFYVSVEDFVKVKKKGK